MWFQLFNFELFRSSDFTWNQSRMDPGQWGAHWLIGCAWNADDADNAEDAEDGEDDDADDAEDADDAADDDDTEDAEDDDAEDAEYAGDVGDAEDADDDDGANDKTSGHYQTGGESDNVAESLRGKRCKGRSPGQAR